MNSTTICASASTSSSSSAQTTCPVHVQFARPKCFCGFTAVSIYPEPTGGIRRSRSAAGPPPTLKNTNWVYECHFTPKQIGMVAPDRCDGCEEDRHRHSMCSRSRSKQDKWWLDESSSGGHTVAKHDEVELWPIRFPYQTTTTTTTSSSGARLDQQDATTATTTLPIGADIRTQTKFLSWTPLERRKVCGFHMHALEWHHMQTIDVNQILMVAKNTACDVFHLSVIRWLGEWATMTTNRNSNIDTDYHLGLKLFRKIRCHCKKESALAKGSCASSSSSSTSLSAPTTRHSASTSTKKEYFVMCTGRVYDKHSDYDIVAQPGSDSYYTYNIRSWIKRSGGFHQCKFQVPLQAAIFDYNLTPIHTRISITDWLSQWLSPPPSRSSFTTTTTRPGTDLATASTWLQRTNALLTTIRNPITDAKRPLLPPPSPYTLTPGPSSSGQTGGWGQVDSDARLDELDKVLQRAVAQHVQEVERVKGKLDSGRLIATTESETQEHHHKEIDMSTFPSVVMLPCNNCTDNHASDFCIVPRAKPILNTKTTIATTTTTVDVPTSVLIDVAGEDGSPPLDPLTELSNALDKADQVLEHRLERHARVFQRTMEARSRLVPYFLPCRSCSYRKAGVDVLPCHHHFLCASCVNKIEFYLVPRAQQTK